MRVVLAHTHWVPPYWRGRAHSAAVRAEFGSLFQYQVMLFAEEALSVLLLPWLCLLLARSSHDITSFLHKVCCQPLLSSGSFSVLYKKRAPEACSRCLPATTSCNGVTSLREFRSAAACGSSAVAACEDSSQPPCQLNNSERC